MKNFAATLLLALIASGIQQINGTNIKELLKSKQNFLKSFGSFKPSQSAKKQNSMPNSMSRESSDGKSQIGFNSQHANQQNSFLEMSSFGSNQFGSQQTFQPNR